MRGDRTEWSAWGDTPEPTPAPRDGTLSLLWLKLRRLAGTRPSTPTDDMEGQLRYERDGDVDGNLYLARHRKGTAYEWAGFQTYVTTAAGIQPALTAAGSAGGGIVHLGPGTFDVSGLLIDSNVWLRGSGVDATELRSTANYPVILTREFATHTGTNNTNSEVNFKISDLTINGMKGTYAGSNGYGIRVHGANFCLERLRIYDCNANGIDTEWSTSLGAPTTTGMRHAMEARVNDVEVHECDGSGIYWNGPHDSMFTNVVAWENGQYGIAAVSAKAGACQFMNCHSWGNTQALAWLIGDGAGYCQLTQCVGEGASTAQLLILAYECTVMGGVWYRAGGGTGIILGQTSPGTIPVASYFIVTTIRGFNGTNQAIVHQNDNGDGWIEALIEQASGAAIGGTPHVSSKRDIRVFGGGTGTVDV